MAISQVSRKTKDTVPALALTLKAGNLRLRLRRAKEVPSLPTNRVSESIGSNWGNAKFKPLNLCGAQVYHAKAPAFATLNVFDVLPIRFW